MAEHRSCAECDKGENVVTGIICLIGIGVAIFGSGGHAIAGAIIAIGFELASVLSKWVAHQ